MNTNKINILILIIFFFGCTIKDSEDDPPTYISDIQFNFHQNENNLYIAAKILPEADGKVLDKVLVEWKGTNNDNIPDSLSLEDTGLSGDIIAADDYYALKFKNDSTVIQNTLGDDSGSVYLDILAIYIGQTKKKSSLFKIGNIIPRIINVSYPDTIKRPDGAVYTFHNINATVFDADGLDDIKWVGFTTRHFININGDTIDTLMNNGNYIYMYDDGGDDILFPPDLTSGDSIGNDGMYSIKLPIYGTGFSEDYDYTKPGTFNLEFITQDKEDEYSLPSIHEIIIQ